MSRAVPDPEQMADAFDNKFGEYFQVDRETSPRNDRHRDLTIIRTEAGMPDKNGFSNFGEPFHEVYRFMSANGYFPVEGERDYVIFAHPRDRSLRRMQSQYSDVYKEKYCAWEYMDDDESPHDSDIRATV